MNLADVIRKIKALQARAADAASTEAEAAMAMQIAAKLLAEYNLTMDEVDVKSAGVNKEYWGDQGKHLCIESWAIRGVEAACNVKCFISGSRIVVVGQPADIETARYFFDLVRNAAHRCYNAWMHTSAWQTACVLSSTRSVSQTFKKGVAQRLSERLIEMSKKIEQPVSNGTNLVVLKNQIINSWISENLKTCPRKAKAPMDNAYYSGRNAANNVSLNSAVRSSTRLQLA